MITRPPLEALWAVVVAFNPPPGFADRIRKIAAQCDGVVIVDNASARPPEHNGAHTLRNDRNLGIARALNQGVEFAARSGATHALLLDHDSEPTDDMAPTLLAALKRDAARASIAVPAILYGHPSIRCRWPQTLSANKFRFRFVYADELQAPTLVDLAIGSGMLVSTSGFIRTGGFDSSLFIDLVDTDYCLRVRKAGSAIIAVPQARLKHALGTVEQKKLFGIVPVYPTHHSAIRHYFIARNRIILSVRYGATFPSWLAYEWLGAAKLALKTLLYEPGRFQKALASLRGLADGIRTVVQRRHGSHNEISS